MKALRTLAMAAVLAFTVGFVGYLITRPSPGVHFAEIRDQAR